MERYLTIALEKRLECGVLDKVRIVVCNVCKLLSYTTQLATSEVEGLIVASSLDDTLTTFTYTIMYSGDVLKDPCNSLIPEDVLEVKCVGCVCRSSNSIRLKDCICEDKHECVNIIKGVNCGR